jgi:ribosome-associated protein
MSKLSDSIVAAIEDKKGQSIVSLDLRGFDGAVCDEFIVCNADSGTQVIAIADGIEEQVFKDHHEWPVRKEGMENALWVIVDYGDVVVHVFRTESREFYRLEDLWADAIIKRF